MSFTPHDEPTFECVSCWDETNGWTFLWCPGEGKLRARAEDKPKRADEMPMTRCGRPHAHRQHLFVVRCHCWPGNTVARVRRERESIRKAEASRPAA